MKHHYCTYFDSYYLTRGLALYESLCRHCSDFRLWILCLDDDAWHTLSRLDLAHARLIRVEELERRFPDLLAAKPNRNRLEYYYTCTPALPAFVLDDSAGVEQVTYLDADMWFFADPQGIFDELGSASIGIIGHRYSPGAARLEAKSGTYNVSWVSFRRDAQARKCLDVWRAQCIAWCYDRTEDGRNADQKYLDEWPSTYGNLKVIEQPGAGCAPWNIDNYRITGDERAVFLDGAPLYFYHFHGLGRVRSRIYDPVLSHFSASMTPAARELIYVPYIAALHALQKMLTESDGGNHPLGNIRTELYSAEKPDRPGRLAALRQAIHICRRVLTKKHLFIPSLPRRAAAMEPRLKKSIPGLGRVRDTPGR